MSASALLTLVSASVAYFLMTCVGEEMGRHQKAHDD